MPIMQKRSKRKSSGGRYRATLVKGSSNRGSNPTHPKIGEKKTVSLRIIGGHKKTRLLEADIANVLDPNTKKCSKSKIKTVVDNKANKNFVRRNILTKGTIIETEAGKARITSKPGQTGTINAVLIKN